MNAIEKMPPPPGDSSTDWDGVTHSHKEATLVRSDSALGDGGPISADDRESRILDDYELEDRLGQGGMGSVYRAQHRRLDKTVAVKLLARDLLGCPQARARFGREMKAIGRLDHQHVVRASDAGFAQGVEYLVMEFVDGVSFTEIVQHEAPSISDCCELIRQAAVGLDYIHAQGMVHRDIKPSNLMLNKQGVVKIADLGIALVAELSPHDGELTLTGQVMGTPDFLAPEQFDNTHDVDGRADIYSLGATLFTLLTGRPPFAGKEYDSLSRKLLAITTKRPPAVRTLRPEVPRALQRVVERMMAKDPSDRFASAAEVTVALEPFCPGANVVALASTDPANPPSSPRSEVQRVGAVESPRATPRKKITVAVLLLMLVTSMVYGWFALQTVSDPPTNTSDPSAPPETVQARRHDVPPVATTVSESPKSADDEHVEDIGATEPGDANSANSDAEKRDDASGDGEPERVAARTPAAGRRPPDRFKSGPGPSLVSTLMGHRSLLLGVDISQDGKLLASAGYDGRVMLWSVPDGEPRGELEGHQSRVTSVAFSPRGSQLVSGGNDKTVRIWSTTGGGLLKTLEGHGKIVTSVAYSDQADLIASGSYDQSVKLWDAHTGELRKTLTGHKSFVLDVGFDPDGSRLASVGRDGRVHLWSLPAGEPLGLLDDFERKVLCVEFSPRGHTIACGDETGSVRIWNRHGEFQREIAAHDGFVRCLSYSVDGGVLVTGGAEGRLKWWRVGTGREMASVDAHGSQIRDVAFSPLGRLVATVGHDFRIKLWRPAKDFPVGRRPLWQRPLAPRDRQPFPAHDRQPFPPHDRPPLPPRDRQPFPPRDRPPLPPGDRP